MSDLDIALWKMITHIVTVEQREFSSVDFLPTFEVDGKEFPIAAGTFRNKVSGLLKDRKIQVVFYSPQAFYTIKEKDVTGPMTGYHTRVITVHDQMRMRYRQLSNDPVYRLIQNIPLGRRSLHDMHLGFKVPGIWSILSSKYEPSPENNGIQLLPWPWKIRDLDIKITVPSADTVSVVIGCSFCPIAVDTHGIVRLSEALAIVRERLSKLIEECNRITGFACNTPIPDHMTWVVTMWHFGVDALTEYKGEKFFTSWEVGQHALITAYTKDWKDDKRRLRIEKQEYPKKSLADALEEKLNSNCAGG